MGCVLCKRGYSDRRSKSTAGQRNDVETTSNTTTTTTASTVVTQQVTSSSGKAEKNEVVVVEKKIRQRRMKSEGSLSYGGSSGQRWPAWLTAVAGEAIADWTPRRASSFEKIDKIGQGTYSNVYKARDLITGKIVALKKVRFDNLEPESVKFMAREILILKKLDHPNIIKLEGLVTSRMSSSLYLVFEYMEHDLSGLAAVQGSKFTEAQIKCFMKQLLSGLEHCHKNGVLHRDIKGSNLLIDNDGILKIADFGLASFYDPRQKQPMTSRVVTLWYRPPELLLGATYYGTGVDLWSAGCILAELLAGKPIMPGRTEVEQLHKIFKLCGSPSEDYWKRSRLPNATLFKPQQPYKRCTLETFKDFPPSSLPLLECLLSIDPDDRGSATAALNSEFFNTEPYACEPSELPKYPPSKELDVKLRDEEARRQRGLSGKSQVVDGNKKVRTRDRTGRAVPAPEANAEIQSNLDRWRVTLCVLKLAKVLEEDFEGMLPIHRASKATIGLLSDDETIKHKYSYIDLVGTVEQVKMAEELILDKVLKTYSSDCYPVILKPPTVHEYEMKITFDKVSSILGLFRAEILRLEMTSGAWITFSPPHPPGVIEPERVATIYGPRENVIKAFSLIRSAMSPVILA